MEVLNKSKKIIFKENTWTFNFGLPVIAGNYWSLFNVTNMGVVQRVNSNALLNNRLTLEIGEILSSGWELSESLKELSMCCSIAVMTLDKFGESKLFGIEWNEEKKEFQIPFNKITLVYQQGQNAVCYDRATIKGVVNNIGYHIPFGFDEICK
jgi:hypothetical protein